MPEIFTWTPAAVGRKYSDSFNVLISNMESGKEQRRAKWSKPKATFELVMDPENTVANAIGNFYIARQGLYESFYLPSFMSETELSQTAAASTSIIYVDSIVGFTSTTGQHGNYVHLKNSSAQEEVKIVSSIVGTTRINLTTGLTYTYAIDDTVQRAYLVRFDTPEDSKEWVSDWFMSRSLKFVEVF